MCGSLAGLTTLEFCDTQIFHIYIISPPLVFECLFYFRFSLEAEILLSQTPTAVAVMDPSHCEETRAGCHNVPNQYYYLRMILIHSLKRDSSENLINKKYLFPQRCQVLVFLSSPVSLRDS